MREALITELAAMVTPLKTHVREGKFAIGDQLFQSRDEAVAHLHEQYASFAELPSETAAASTSTGGFKDAHHAMKKPHPHRPIKGLIHTSFIYGGAGSINGGGVYDMPCADCGQPGSSPGHAEATSGSSTSGGTATALLESAGGYPCPCGRDFASAVAFARHVVTFAEAEEVVDAAEAVKMADGSYPISDQKSANSAWKLRAHSKDHSESQVMAHVRKAVKQLGLKMPGPAADSSALLSEIACLPCERRFGTEDALVSHLKLVHR